MVNYRGKTSDSGEYYTEIIAEFLCNNINEFQKGIKVISRQVSYKIKNHTGNVPISNRKEEIIAIKMFNQSDKDGYFYPFIGEIIDYQTPLKSKQKDVAGKIDLLAYNNQILHMLELKKPDNKETLLRCVLEGYTYLKTVDQKKLLSDFSLHKSTKIVASPLVFKGSSQYLEVKENRKWLEQLMAYLESRPYYVIENDGYYSVENK